jgi:hypothetical protein
MLHHMCMRLGLFVISPSSWLLWRRGRLPDQVSIRALVKSLAPLRLLPLVALALFDVRTVWSAV